MRRANPFFGLCVGEAIHNMLGPITPEENSTYLPIISNIKKATIRESYYNILRLDGSKDTMALS
jgi:hypothetical protein